MQPIRSKQAEIILPTAVDRAFDYAVPEGMKLSSGHIVRVPFGKKTVLGVIWGEGTAQIAAGKIKPISAVLDQFPPLSKNFRKFIDWSAWYNCAPKGAVLKMALCINDIEKTGRLTMPATPEHPPQLATLKDAQAEAAQTLSAALENGFSTTLLDGVTGSGKTEVYFDTIARLLAKEDGSQICILLPEIALTLQFVERFTKRFGFMPVVWNSSVTPARKRVGWQAVATGKAPIVVGARSALFLPYKNLKLIIIDEEHDNSYKQQDGVYYHARDMAIARARMEQFPVILVSATPSIESYYNSQQGKYQSLLLPARHGGASMPDINMIDLRETPPEREQFIAPPLRQALADTLAAGNQSLLFLNRRGYAPLVLCRACGHRFECKHCSSWLVLHQKNAKKRETKKAEVSRPNSPEPCLMEVSADTSGGEKNNASAMSHASCKSQQTFTEAKKRQWLQCHHCDQRHPLPETCPECEAEDSLHACGPGVERLLEEVTDFLPQARIGVLASDSNTGNEELQETLTAMQDGKIDVLIGTQIVAKGHHFAGLATVGVVDADLGLSGGELRACEQTYQLLHQISGRAGREKTKGTVYLQSYYPDHPVMQALVSGTRDAFLTAEIDARRLAHMPPFSRLAALIIDGQNEAHVKQTATMLAHMAPHLEGVQILGPAPAPLSLLRGRFRYRMLIQASRNANLPNIMRDWVTHQNWASTVRVKIDMDPQSFM